jgi:hypothetical protein
MRSSFSRSPSSIFETGMPVQRETTSATSSSVTLLRSSVRSVVLSAACACCSCFSSSGSGRTAARTCASDHRRAAPPRDRASGCSISPLIAAAPCREAFSAFQISSRSANSRSMRRSALQQFQLLLRSLVLSFFTASRSILSWISAGRAIHRLGLGVDLHADAARRLVDQVDGLVRQLAVGDVALDRRAAATIAASVISTPWCTS